MRYVLLACLIAGTALVCQADSPSLDQELAAVHYQAVLGNSTIEKIEERYLALISGTMSAADKGRVYRAIAELYGPMHPRSTAEIGAMYCEEALSYPQPPDAAGQLYFYWAMEVDAIIKGWQGGRYQVGRRRELDIALRGLRTVLSAGAPRKRVIAPPVGLVSVVGSHPEIEKQHQEEWAAHNKAVYLNALADCRADLESLCAYIYRHPPADPEELRTLATRALPKHPEVVQEIMEKLKSSK